MKIRVLPVTAILLVVIAAAALPTLWRRAPPKSRVWQKMVIIGFDGMDPDLVLQLVRDRKLPNFKRLIDQGGLYPLGTTHSAESPTAWASFATGVNPGKHNIYDFLVRDTSTYLPDLGMVRREPPPVLFDFPPDAETKTFFLPRAAPLLVA